MTWLILTTILMFSFSDGGDVSYNTRPDMFSQFEPTNTSEVDWGIAEIRATALLKTDL